MDEFIDEPEHLNRGAKTIRKNTIWLFAGQVIGRGLRSFLMIFAGIQLSRAEYGSISYALSLVTLLTVLSDVGINAFLTREIIKTPAKKREYLSTIFFMKIAALLTLGSVFIIFANFFKAVEGFAELVPFMVFIFIFDSLRDLGAAIARASEKMEIEGLNHIITNFFIAISGFALLYVSPTGANLAMAYVFGIGLGFVSIGISLRSELGGLFKHFERILVGKIISSAWPFGILGLMATIMINTDVFLIGFFRSVDQIAAYSAGQKIIQLLYIAPTMLATAFFPAFSRFSANIPKFRQLFEQALSLSFLIAIPLAIGTVMLGDQIMDLIYRGQYPDGIASFIILGATLVIVFPSVLIGNAIFAHNRQKDFIRYAIIGIAGNVILDILLIPIFGIVGSAAATLLNQLVINFFAWNIMKRTASFEIFSKIKNLIFYAVLMGLLTVLLKIAGVAVLLNVTISMAFYAGLLLLFRERTLFEFLGWRKT